MPLSSQNLSKPSEHFRAAALSLATTAALLCSATLSFGQNQKLEPMLGINRGQAQPTVATLVIGINDSVGSIAEPGWPLVVSGVTLPEGKSSTIPLPSGLVLKLTDENGVDANVTLEPVPPSTTSTDDTSRSWLAAGSATTRLTPQRYRVSVVAPPKDWRIEAGEFMVVAPNSERARLLGHLKIQRAVVLSQDDDALAEADRLIAANDKDKQAWIAKGDILMLKDLPNEALQAFDRALSLHQKTEREPIAIQMRRRAAFFRSLEKRGGVAPKSTR
jgi:hypothetical protein